MDNPSTSSPPPTPTPDPNFTAALEWQLRRELRRDAAPAAATPQRPKTLTLIAVALTSALAGAACLGAAMQVQESRRGQVIIAGLVLSESAAKQTVQVARKVEQASEAMLNAGYTTPEGVRRAATRATLADTALRITQLDLAEARTTSRPPRKDLAAPKLSGRDFVLERLIIEKERADAVAKCEAEVLDITRKRIAAGLMTSAEAAEAELAVQLSTEAAATVAARIALREKFIAGTLTAEAVEQQDLQARALAAQNLAQAKLTAAQKKLDYLNQRRAVGDVSNLEVSEAQLDVTNCQVELDIAKAELAALQAAP